MSASAYQLRPPADLLFRSFHGTRLVADNELASPADVQALVASGDGFITLATLIDEVSGSLPSEGEQARYQLEKAAATLLYLQRYYRIVPKPAPDHRQ